MSRDANREELLAQTLSADQAARHEACRALCDHIEGRSWPAAETRGVLQSLLDGIRPYEHAQHLDDLYDCMLAAPPGPPLDGQRLLIALADAGLHLPQYLRLLYQCGRPYWPLIAWYHRDPETRPLVESLFPTGDRLDWASASKDELLALARSREAQEAVAGGRAGAAGGGGALWGCRW